MGLFIHQIASVSPVGLSSPGSALSSRHHFLIQENGNWLARIPADLEVEFQSFLKREKSLRHFDRLVQLACFAGRQLDLSSVNPQKTAVFFGSSRGPTNNWENHFKHFLAHESCLSQASPSTTLGSSASVLSHFLGIEGPASDHSTTCSSFGTGLLHAKAWLDAGMIEQALVVGSESPLTEFTMAQMKSMGISAENQDNYPCEPFSGKSNGGMVLGEAGVVCLLSNNPENALAKISGLGWASEKIPSKTGLSGESLKQAMRMALEDAKQDQVDLIIPHAPGTVKGDIAEKQAMEEVFGAALPEYGNLKWKYGHSLGASMGQSIELGLAKMNLDFSFHSPHSPLTMPCKNVLINAVGFGGNAISMLMTEVRGK